MVIGSLHVFFPMMVLPVASALGRIDPSLEDAARTLGSPERTDQLLRRAPVPSTASPVDRARQYGGVAGPSGCGKTTTLRMIAGLVEPNAGDIFIDDRRITRAPVHRRNIGVLFQNYALFPHMTVAENIAFGLETRSVKGSAAAARVEGALRLVQLSGYGDRLPVAALRRSAAAGGAGLGAGRRTDAAIARRAARSARQELAREHADGTARAAAAARRHNGLRHPRPGRGADDGRPHCLHA